jgi:16S rRNA (guanine966-N2)-methyltransferase
VASVLRIVGGELRGRRLKAPPGARPTGERTREALASALTARDAVEGRAVLELFAGSGALGLELLSRGAASLVAVDRDRAACRCVRDNARALALDERVSVLCEDLLSRTPRALRRIAELTTDRFDLVVADPPYALAGRLPGLVRALADAALIGDGAVIALEHAHADAPAPPAGFTLAARYRHGDTGLSLWVATDDT